MFSVAGLLPLRGPMKLQNSSQNWSRNGQLEAESSHNANRRDELEELIHS